MTDKGETKKEKERAEVKLEEDLEDDVINDAEEITDMDEVSAVQFRRIS